MFCSTGFWSGWIRSQWADLSPIIIDKIVVAFISKRYIKKFTIIVSLFVLGLGACTYSTVNIRQENASLVLTMYRARPLAEANHGKIDLTVHDCIRLALENSLDLQTAIWEEQAKGVVFHIKWTDFF